MVERRQLGRLKKKNSTKKAPQAIKWMFERMAVMIGVKSSVSLLPKNKGFEIPFKVTEWLLVRLPPQCQLHNLVFACMYLGLPWVPP